MVVILPLSPKTPIARAIHFLPPQSGRTCADALGIYRHEGTVVFSVLGMVLVEFRGREWPENGRTTVLLPSLRLKAKQGPPGLAGSSDCPM